MATAEQVLAMMEMNAIEHPYCIIDADSRKITVPDEYKLLGVESDENVERVYFKCPKIVGDGIDLSTLGLRINYQNANSQKDSYPVDELTVENEFITFSWLLSRKAVAYKGTVKFIVCAVRTGDDGMVSNEWNTTIASAEVLEGLEVDFSSIPDEEGKDLLESLIAQSQVKLMEVGEATEEAKRSAERADTAADSAGHAADAANNAAEEARRAVEELKGNIGIDDNVVSENKTYSSKKIEEMAAVNWIPKLDGKFKFTKCTGSYQDGILTIESVDISTAQYAYFELKNLKQNTKYTVSWKSTRTGNIGGGIGVLGRKGSNYTTLVNTDTNTLNGFCYFDSGAYDAISFNFYCGNQNSQIGDSATFWDIMLVEGEHPSGYIENVRDIVKKMAGIDAETLDVASRFDTISSGDVLDIKKSGIYFAGSNLTGKPENTGNGMLIVAYSGESNRVYVYIGTNHSLYVRRFAGGGNTDSGWVNKALTVDDIVNNFTTTIAGKALDARAGKTLDEKIEGVKSDVTELNGKTEKLQAHELCIPGDTTNAPPNNKFLNISLKDRFNAVNRCHYFRQPNGTAFEGCPTPLKAQEFIGYREVYWYSTINVMVKLIEFYPMHGRVWTNFYNNGTWTGWKSITPV